MPQFSLGFRVTARRLQTAGGQPPALVPGADWSGSASSGFTNAPIDPVRVTAKPAMQLMVVPNQYYKDRLIVGVIAGANNAGTLSDNMGLEAVIVHFEGRTARIMSPSFQVIEDANGIQVSYFGWWAVLVNDGRNGHANAYFEAIPKDPTMQHRVIGPFRFSPQPILHDFIVDVAPSQVAAAGVRYQSIGDALIWLRQQSADNPLINIVEAGVYDISPTGGSYAGGLGYCTIQASVPITISRNDFTVMRPRYDGLCFRGANITFDTAKTASFGHDSLGNQYWFDGIKIVNSNGRYSLWQKGQRPISKFLGGRAYVTECELDAVSFGVTGSSLARGNTMYGGYNDAVTNGACIVYNRVDDWDSRDGWKVHLPSMTVLYNGVELTASIALSGGNENDGRIITVRWGSNVAHFVLSNSQSAFVADTNYSVRNVVDWLNGLGVGFEATLLDDSRRATALSIDQNAGAAFPATNLKDVSLTLVTHFDLHTDWYQHDFSGVSEMGENCVIAFNTVTNFAGQVLFISAINGPARDYLIFNNGFHTKPDVENFSQFGRSMQSHVVVAHNTWTAQKMLLRPNTGYNPDTYCLYANNSLGDLFWYGVPDDDLLMANNHLLGDALGEFLGISTTVGGSANDTVPAAGIGNFAPAGALAANLKAAVISMDRVGRPRGGLDAAGCDAVS